MENITTLDDVKIYNGIYNELAEHLGLETMMMLFSRYKGQSISFPMSLYNNEWKKIQILKEHANGVSVRDLAKKYQYSEQRIRVILKGGKK